MKDLRLLTRARFRLLALILCLAATVPQLHAQTYTVAGSDTQALGASWSPSTESNDMILYSGNIYYLVKSVTYSSSTTYEYKITVNHSWNTSYGNNGGSGNASYAVSAGSGFTTYVFNSSTHVPRVVSSCMTVVIAGDDTQALGSSTWNGTNTSNSMTTTDGITYTMTKTVDYTSSGTKQCKAVVDGNQWFGNSSGGNVSYNIPAAGSYTVTYTYNAVTGIVSVNVQANAPVIPDYYITGDTGLGLSGWSFNQFTTMTYDANNDIYTYSHNVASAGTYYFAFADGAGSDWNDFNGNHRYGPSSGNEDVTLGSWAPTQKGGGSYAVTVDAGTVTITFDIAHMRYKVEGTALVIIPDYYVVGDIFPNGWNTGASTQMTDNNGTYTWISGQMHLDAGTYYEYKVLDSNGTYHPSGANATFHVDVPGTYTVTVTYDSNNGTVNAVPALDQADPSYNYTFYVLPDDGTTTPTLYLWGTNNNSYHPNGDWPGTAMGTTEQLADGNTWYKYTGALYANLMNAVVNNGNNGHQTADITSLAPDTYYIYWNVNSNTHTITTTAPVPAPTYDYTIYVRYKGDDTPYMYMWDGANTELLGAFPGTDLTTFTSEQINGYTYYKYVVTGSNYPTLNMILNEGSSSAQTQNLGIASGTSYYTYGGGNTVSGPNAAADPAIIYYAESDFGGWTTDGTQMTSNGDGSYSKTFTGVTLSKGTQYGYKVFGNDGTSEGVWIGDSNGNNATLTPEMSGTYDVTITLNSDGTISHTLTMTAPATIYITGDGVLGGFSCNNGIAMTYTSNGIYTYATTLSENATTQFVFADGQGDNADDWNNFNSTYRIGPANGDETYVLNSGYTSTQKAGGDNGSYSVVAGAGTLTFYFDAINMQYKVEGAGATYPYTFYVLPSDGNVTPKLYLWNGNYFPAGEWSGTTMTDTEQLADYNTWYKLTVNSLSNVLNAIVNDGNGGQTANIENLAPGTYYINWNTSDNNYTISTTAPGLQNYYITGSNELGLGWSAAPTTAMTFDPTTRRYTYSGTLATSGSYGFVFANGQGANAEDWENFNNNFRIGPTNGDETIIVNSGWHGTQQSHGDHGAYMVNLSNGPFTITYDPATNQFEVTGIQPIFITGEPGLGLSWEYAPKKLMTYDANTGYYTYSYDLAKEEVYHFVFADGQASGNNDEEGWAVFNGTYRIGPTGDSDERYLVGVDDWMSTQYARIPGGTPAYSYYAKMAKGTATIYFDYAGGDSTSMRFKILTQNAASGDLYMMGGLTIDSVQHYYNANDGVLMKYDQSKELYYLNHVILNNNASFCFTTLLGHSSDDWSNVGTRYGNNDTSDPHYYEAPGGDGQIGHFKVFSEKVNTQMPLDEWDDTEGEWKMYTAGIYNVVVSLEEGWVKLIKTDQFTLFPMNVYLTTADGCTFNVEPGDDGTSYDHTMFNGGTWPLSAYNRLVGGWDPTSDSTHYAVTYIGDTIAANNDGEQYDWWHWQVTASICEIFFTDDQGNVTDTIERKAGVLWLVLNADGTFTDVTREHFDFSATSLPSNVVVDEGHCYVYFINTVGWQTVHFTAWDDDPNTPYCDADGNNLEEWPGQAMTCIGIDPETGYEVWEYDLGPIIEMGLHDPVGVLFNDGTPNATTDAKEQTGDADYINGGVYDYLGLLDDAHSLSSLIHHGTLMVRYTVSDDLVGVYYDDDAKTDIYDDEGVFLETVVGALYAKDMNNYPEPSVQPDGTYDYVYDICSAKGITDGESQIMDKKKSYDQSNWVKLIHSPNYDGGHPEPLLPSQRPYLKNYVGKVIPGGTLHLFMCDTINPTAHVLSIPPSADLQDMAYEPNVYVSSHFNDTVVFDYVHKEWQPKRLDGTEPYKGNSRYAAQVTWIYDNQTGDVLRGEVKYRPVDDINYRMFYVAPKPQEIAYLTWIVYDNENLDGAYGSYDHNQYYPTTTVARTLPNDPGRFYAPKSWNRSVTIPGDWRWLSEDELTDSLGGYGSLYGPYSNGYDQYGGVKVNWSLFGDSINHDVTVGNESYQWWQIFQPGQAYKIMALIRYAHGNSPGYQPNECYGPGNGADGNNATTSPHNAPMRAPYRQDNGQGGYANMYFTSDYQGFDSSKFIIFPLKASPSGSNGSDLGNVTRVKEVATQREVISVRYYNLMGVESSKPFEGINIVVTTYSDGSRTSKKILR